MSSVILRIHAVGTQDGNLHLFEEAKRRVLSLGINLGPASLGFSKFGRCVEVRVGSVINECHARHVARLIQCNLTGVYTTSMFADYHPCILEPNRRRITQPIRVNRTLGFLLESRQPVTLDQVAEAVELTPESVSRILRVSCNRRLVEVLPRRGADEQFRLTEDGKKRACQELRTPPVAVKQNPASQRRTGCDDVLEKLAQGNPMSTADLIHATIWSKPTVRRAIIQLEAEGLIAAVGTGEPVNRANYYLPTDKGRKYLEAALG